MVDVQVKGIGSRCPTVSVSHIEGARIVKEDDDFVYYEYEEDGIMMRYTHDKTLAMIPKNLPKLLAEKIKENKLNGSWYRDKEGNQIDIDRLEELLQDNDYRVVNQEVIGPFFVSTVWLGVPHGIMPEFNYFETIIFESRDTSDPRNNLGKEVDCWRYHNKEEAEKGHVEICELVRRRVANGKWDGPEAN